MFNLGLQRWRLGKLEAAIKAMEVCLAKEPNSAPAKTLTALCLEALDKKSEAQQAKDDAGTSYGPPAKMEDWELGWYETWAKSAGDGKATDAAAAERAKRLAKDTLAGEQVLRPELRPALEKRR